MIKIVVLVVEMAMIYIMDHVYQIIIVDLAIILIQNLVNVNNVLLIAKIVYQILKIVLHVWMECSYKIILVLNVIQTV